MKKSNLNEIESLEYQAILKNGKIQFDTKSDATGVASYILSSFHGRYDLAEAMSSLPSNNFISWIEKVRNSIFFGELAYAEKLLGELNAKSDIELCEISLEHHRLDFYRGDYKKVLAQSQETLKSAGLTPWSRITIHQIRGHCLINLNKYIEAIHELRRAVSFGSIYDITDAAFTAHTQLVVCFSKLRKIDEARRELETTKGLLQKVPKNGTYVERLAKTLRCEHFYFMAKEEKDLALQNLFEAQNLYEWLLDTDMQDLCRKNINEITPEQLNEKTLKGVLSLSRWKYFTRFHLVLSLNPKGVNDLSQNPQLSKILVCICSGPISLPDLFQQVWGLKFVRHIHEPPLRAALSKLRKLCPPGAITVKGGLVSVV